MHNARKFAVIDIDSHHFQTSFEVVETDGVTVKSGLMQGSWSFKFISFGFSRFC